MSKIIYYIFFNTVRPGRYLFACAKGNAPGWPGHCVGIVLKVQLCLDGRGGREGDNKSEV